MKLKLKINYLKERVGVSEKRLRLIYDNSSKCRRHCIAIYAENYR